MFYYYFFNSPSSSGQELSGPSPSQVNSSFCFVDGQIFLELSHLKILLLNNLLLLHDSVSSEFYLFCLTKFTPKNIFETLLFATLISIQLKGACRD